MPIVNRPQSVHAEAVWRRIVSHSGAAFHQVRGKPFTYEARGRTIYLHTTNWVIGRAAVEQALTRMPLDRVSDLQDRSAPSYLYAILTPIGLQRRQPTKGTFALGANHAASTLR